MSEQNSPNQEIKTLFTDIAKIEELIPETSWNEDQKSNAIALVEGIKEQLSQQQNVTELSIAIASKALTLLREAFNLALNEKHEKEENAKLVEKHPLTDLPNRRGFDRLATLMFAKFERKHISSPSILFIDIDKFKSINDTYGHAIGDNAIIKVAKALQNIVRESDILTHWAGDEFAIISEDGCPNALRERIYSAFERESLYIKNENKRVPLSLSVGIGIIEENDASFESALKKADENMYHEKQNGHTRLPPPSGDVSFALE